ncbi:MAG: PAS domain S-box protein [Syntrophaceae bacterium]|nr:PAS domain S-box protein [Syntrophaceae bacterium]
MTGPGKDPCLREIAALRERVRYLEEVEKEFAALARALKDSEERYRFVVKEIRDGIFIAQDGRVKVANPSMTELVGFTAEELDAVPIADLVRPEDRERVLGRYREILSGADIKGALAFRALRKGGQEFQAEVRAVSITWEERPAALCLLRDVTRQAHLESRLQYARKMEAVGTLAGGIAHDFNNHLQGISGYIQLLMMRGDRDRTEQGWLLQIERSVQRAAALTKQLLIFSRREESRLEPLDLNEVVRQAQKTLARTIPESIEAELRLAADLNPIDGDAVQLEHALFNLGINAKDAMPDGGKIVIGTRNVRLDEAFCRRHAGVKPGDYVELSFADTGRGMERETLERIFEPFYTTKSAGSGSGWGSPSSTQSSRVTTGSSSAKAVRPRGRSSGSWCPPGNGRGPSRERRPERRPTTGGWRRSSSSTTKWTSSTSARTPSSSSATRRSWPAAARRPSKPTRGGAGT